MFFLLVWGIFVLPCSGWVDWIYPTADGLTFNYLDNIWFTWTSNISDSEQAIAEGYPTYADARIDLFCAPNSTTPQNQYQNSFQDVVRSNGTELLDSTKYEDIYAIFFQDTSFGFCYMQLQDLSGAVYGNSTGFTLTSNDQASPQTFGENATAFTTSAPLFSTSVTTTEVLTTSSIPSSSVSATSTLFDSSSTTTSAIPSPSQQPISNNTLSPAAIAGVSIGSFFGVFAVISLILLVRRFTRSQRQQGERSELNGTTPSLPSNYNIAEIGEGRPFYEANGISRPPELYGTPRGELEGIIPEM